MTSRESLQAIELLYGGTLDDADLWQPFLNHCCNALRADGGNVVWSGSGGAEGAAIIDNHGTLADRNLYREKYVDKDWLVQRLGSEAPLRRAVHAGMYPKDLIREYIDSEYFQEFAKNTCIWMSMGAWVRRDCEVSAWAGFHRRCFERPFSPAEVDFFEGLHSHITRVFEHGEHLALLEETERLLGRTGHGIFLLDHDGRVVYSNVAAGRVIREGGLGVRRLLLSAESRRDDSRLQKAVSAVLSSENRSTSATLRLSRSGHSAALIVRIARNNRREPFDHARRIRVRAIVTVIDPAWEPMLRADVLRSMFCFTAREVDVAQLAALGLKPKVVAEQLSVSYETVRSHLKSIMQKSGVSGHGELVALLCRFQRQ